MTIGAVPPALAFLAGAASFLSPCVLPLVPVYLAYLARGADAGDGHRRTTAALNSFAFVAGVAVVLIVLLYALRTVLSPVRTYVAPVAGVLVIVFALQVAGLLRIPRLDREFRVLKAMPAVGGPVGGLLLGASFAIGWTPCVGVILGAVLSSGISSGTTAQGMVLMLAYSAGLGVPFLILGMASVEATGRLKTLARWRRPIDLASATVLAAMGALLLTGSLTTITQLATRVVPAWDPFGL